MDNTKENLIFAKLFEMDNKISVLETDKKVLYKRVIDLNDRVNNQFKILSNRIDNKIENVRSLIRVGYKGINPMLNNMLAVLRLDIETGKKHQETTVNDINEIAAYLHNLIEIERKRIGFTEEDLQKQIDFLKICK